MRVKPEPPQFPLRTDRAQRTRTGLIDAASTLFAEIGYTATTIEAIARRAGVARATVFTSMPGGKPQLLKEARDRAIAGDDEPVPIPQRGWFLQAMGQTDPRELLRLQAANYRHILQRSAALERALASAASSDPALAELFAEARRQRHVGALIVSRRLAELHALGGQTPDEAADTIYALASPDLYLLMTGDRRWSPERFQGWLTAQLVSSLL